MTVSVEISLYPLQNEYKQIILDFIDELNKNKKIKVETNGMSTQLFGDYDDVMLLLTNEIRSVFEKNKAMIIIKIGKGELRYDRS